MRIQVSVCLFVISMPIVSSWKCGIGPFTGAVSYMLAFPADVPGVDNCCIEHDALVDGFHVAREEADRVFCQCLSNNQNWYVSNIVRPIFCKSVELYTKWFEREKAKEHVTNLIRGFRFDRFR